MSDERGLGGCADAGVGEEILTREGDEGTFSSTRLATEREESSRGEEHRGSSNASSDASREVCRSGDREG